jgi:hypothetical protein
MAIVKPILGVQHTLDKAGKREYTRDYVVTMATANADPSSVRLATGVPRIGQSWTMGGVTDAGALCTEVEPQQSDDSPSVWTVTCRWSSDHGDLEEEPNPLLRPPTISWSSTREERVEFKDRQGNKYRNTVGDPFDPPPSTQDVHPLLTITRNEASFSAAVAYQYTNAVNSATFYGAAAGYVRINGISASSKVEGEYSFWEVTYEIQFNPRKWVPYEVLNAGPRFKAVAGADPEQNKDKNGIPTTTPCLLKEDGTKVAEDGEPYYINFYLYDQVSFSALNLE